MRLLPEITQRRNIQTETTSRGTGSLSWMGHRLYDPTAEPKRENRDLRKRESTEKCLEFCSLIPHFPASHTNQFCVVSSLPALNSSVLKTKLLSMRCFHNQCQDPTSRQKTGLRQPYALFRVHSNRPDCSTAIFFCSIPSFQILCSVRSSLSMCSLCLADKMGTHARSQPSNLLRLFVYSARDSLRALCCAPPLRLSFTERTSTYTACPLSASF